MAESAAHPKGERHERTSDDDFSERRACRQPSCHSCTSAPRRRPHGRFWRRPRRRHARRSLWWWKTSFRWRWPLLLRPWLPVLSVIQPAVHLHLLNAERIRKLPTCGFRYPVSLAFELARIASAQPNNLPILDTARSGIKVNSRHLVQRLSTLRITTADTVTICKLTLL